MPPDQGDLFADDPEHQPAAPPPPQAPKQPKPPKPPKPAVPLKVKTKAELLPARPIGKKGNIYVGTCSWTDPSLIRSKRFYPPGFGSSEKRLAYYASRFPIVEVDSSFFAMPQPSNSAVWVERTPADFVFNIKAFRVFTGHQTPPASLPPDIRDAMPPLKGRAKNYYYQDMPEELRTEMWRRYIEAVAPLRVSGKLRAVHFQFAPWVTAGPEWKAHVEECVNRMSGHHLAVEFRNRSWLNEQAAPETLAWEREMGVSHVVVDEPQEVGNFGHAVWAVTNRKLAVVRLHGRNDETWTGQEQLASSDRFNYEYSQAEMKEMAARMVALAEEAFELQVLLNVNFEDQGVRAADDLIDILSLISHDGSAGHPGAAQGH